MKIQLSHSEVIDLVKQHIAGFGIDLSTRQVEITMTETGEVDVTIESEAKETSEKTGRKRGPKPKAHVEPVEETKEEEQEEEVAIVQDELTVPDTPVSIFG